MTPPRRLLALCVLACSGCIAIVGFDDFDPNAPAAIVADAGPATDAGPGDFQLSATPERILIHRGETVHAKLAIAAASGGAPSAVVTAADSPNGVTTDAVGRGLTAGAAADIQITAAADAPFAGGTLTFRATSGTVEHSATIGIAVRGAPGTLDETFGDGGMLTVTTPGPTFSGRDLGTWADDAILVAGDVDDGDGGISVGLARYLPDGAPDPGFRGVGAAIQSLGADYGGAVAATTLANGGLVVAGDDSLGTTTYVARIRPDGTLDETFNGGIVKAPPLAPLSVLVDGDEIVVVGKGINVPRLFRLSAGGNVDTTFGDAGVVDDVQRGRVGRAALADGGGIAVPISTNGGNTASCAILEVPRDGHALVEPPAYGTTRCDVAAAAIDGAGRRGLTGAHKIPQSLTIPPALLVGMVQSDGGIASIDGGVVVTSMDDAIGTRIAFDDAGRIVVAGVTGDQAFVARLLPDGTFDSSFAGTGRATYFIGGSNDAFGLAIQRDGRIVVGTRGGDAQPTVIARFWP